MESIGQQLKKAREGKKMTMPEVAHAAKASIRYIEAIEIDNFEAFPAPIYAIGFIRIYAGCVGVNPQPLMQAFRDRAAIRSPGSVKKSRGVESAPPKKQHAAEVALAGKVRQADPVADPAASVLNTFSMRCRSALAKVHWLAIEDRCASLSAIRLPVETWKSILFITGVVLLVIMAALVLGWYILLKPGAEPSAASRWLAEPPVPYLGVE
jgi:transcriptional regulator with XRE-family HTH domain